MSARLRYAPGKLTGARDPASASGQPLALWWLLAVAMGADGNVVHQVKATRHGKATERVMTPMQFMSRLVALIPPPYRPLIRFHGLFAPHCSWRSQVVARTEGCRHGQHARCASARRATSESCDRPVAELGRGQCRGSGPSRGRGDKCSSQRALTAICPVPAPVPTSGRAERVCRPAPDTPAHCAPQALRAASSRVPWAELLKRVYDVNALACPCGGRLEFISLILEPEVAREILQSLHLPSELPPVARARSPDPRDELPVDWQSEPPSCAAKLEPSPTATETPVEASTRVDRVRRSALDQLSKARSMDRALLS